jgi:hypothetical protein
MLHDKDYHYNCTVKHELTFGFGYYRWEDYEYTYIRPENRFSYLGNGWTKGETIPDRDMTPYLRLEEDNDLRDIHERWWDL